MDALWNSNNKWYGREFMKHNEAAGTIPEEQAGSRKFRRAAEVALKKVLSMDLLRQFKQAGFLCSNNAIQCYNRIIHCVAMLAMLRMGADKNAMTSLFGQLQQADHYVMTGYGLSEFSYGVMQGNGMGPIIWLAISVVLIQIMSSMGFGALFLAAITATQLQLMGFAFVDNTDLLQTAPDVATLATACLHLFQAAIDCWEGCLRVTGGGIHPDKSFWCLIDHKWNSQTCKWEYVSATNAPTEATIRKPNGEERTTLKQIEPHESMKTLGIEITMDGNQEGEKDYLRQQAQNFADKLRTAPGLNKNDAWEAMMTQILATFHYPVAATQLSEKEWNKVCAPVMGVGLNKSGISRMFPRDVLFRPLLYQGMGVIHPFHYQELEHLTILLKNCTDDTEIGKLLQHSLEILRVEMGVPGDLTGHAYTLWENCVTNCWLKNLWHYCDTFDLQLADNLPHLLLSRENDQFLMLAFKEAGYGAKELGILNQAGGKELLHKHEGTWAVYEARRQTRSGSLFYKTNRRVSTLQASARPADVYSRDPNLNHVILESYSTHCMPTERELQPQPDTLQAALPQQDNPRHWAVKTVQQKQRYQDDGQNVATAIRNGSCRAVTDGSYENTHGTAGFCIHGDDPNKQLEGSNRTPGHPDDQSAYHSELGGVVGALTLLQTLCSYHNITSGKVELGLDCESAIHKLEDSQPPKVHNPSYDMIMEARQMIAQLPIEVKLRWTEGHLDSKGKRKDWWAQQNI
eukprot:15365367-Ditylum_brightwellii.AAC.1